ncbi:MAG: hypothetical protein HYV13_02830 [Candidatus Doudnabacteria bacterium]|nr:hypothetical protein [Candidatus Doudnabacteria bacterium]
MENLDQNLPSAAPEASLPESQIPSPQPSSKKNLIIGSIALALILLAGGALAYFYYPPSPEKVAARMAKMVADAKSTDFSVKMDMELNAALAPELGGESRQVKISVELDGASDSSDANNPKFYALTKVSGEALVISADVRVIGKVFYIKLNEAPFLGFIDPGQVKNQWIKVDIEQLNKDLGLPEQSYKSLTEEQKKLITALYENSKIIKLAQRLGSEKVNGAAASHYRFTIDKQELTAFMRRTIEITNEELTEEMKAEFEKAIGQLEFEPGEIWIGRKDNLPYKIVMAMNMNSSDENPTSGKWTFIINFKSFNQPVGVEAPSNSKSFNEVFGDLMGSMNAQPPIPVN